MTISVEEVVRIESLAYPEQFQQMDDCEDWEDIADYCDVEEEDLLVLGEEGHWYALIARHEDNMAEFVDIAKIPNSPKVPKRKILKQLREAGIKYIGAELRECTSYRVLKLMPLFLLGIRIMEDERYYDEDFEEWMHALKIKI